MAALPSDPPQNILEARPWLIAFNEAISQAAVVSTQTANTIFAGPTSGGAAVPGFRALVLNDLPNTYVLGVLQSNNASASVGSVLLQRFTGSTGSQTITLPPANDGSGKPRLLYFKNMASVTVTLARAGSDTIVASGSTSTITSAPITTGNVAELISDGVNQWYII